MTAALAEPTLAEPAPLLREQITAQYGAGMARARRDPVEQARAYQAELEQLRDEMHAREADLMRARDDALARAVIEEGYTPGEVSRRLDKRVSDTHVRKAADRAREIEEAVARATRRNDR